MQIIQELQADGAVKWFAIAGDLDIHFKSGERIEIDPEQAWFWTDEWQAGEREVDDALAEGRFRIVDSVDDIFKNL